MKKIKKKKPKVKQIFSTCCWCGLKIRNNQERFSLGGMKRPEVDISKYEGGIMPINIYTLNKIIWVIVPTLDSDAHKEGYDFIFTLCSEECGDQLEEVLKKRKN